MKTVDLTAPFDRVILGQNQFFGVNHISDAHGKERDFHFADPAHIEQLLEAALDQGMTGLTITTHPRTPQIMEIVRRNPRLREGLSIYPGIPDPGKLMRLFSELGLVKALQETLGRAKASTRMGVLFDGLGNIVTRDFLGLVRNLIDIEMGPFNGVRVRGVFLTNNLNDLALGLDLKDVFLTFVDHISGRVGAVPAFNTTNLSFHLRKMKEYGIPRLPVMAAINPLGFLVNPSLEDFLAAAREHEARIVAMSVLASGHITPQRAAAFLATVPGLESLTVGASTPEHLAETMQAIRESLGPVWGDIPAAAPRR